MNFAKLTTIHDLCLQLQIRWRMEYDEACDEWEFELLSAAPGECRAFRKYTGDYGCERMLETVLAFLSRMGGEDV